MAVKGILAGTAAQRTAYSTALLSTGQWWAQVSTDNVPVLEGYYWWTGNAWTLNNAVGDQPTLFLECTTYPGARIVAITNSTTDIVGVVQIKAQTTGNMASGFGSSIRFTIDDNAISPNDIGLNAAVRTNADDSGRLIFMASLGGVMGEIASMFSADKSMNLLGYLNLIADDGLGHIQMTEVAAPSAASADGGKIFLRDNGAGKTQLCIIFNTGAIQVIATQP